MIALALRDRSGIGCQHGLHLRAALIFLCGNAGLAASVAVGLARGFECRGANFGADIVTAFDIVVTGKTENDKSVRRGAGKLHRQRAILRAVLGSWRQHLSVGDFSAKGLRQLLQTNIHVPLSKKRKRDG